MGWICGSGVLAPVLVGVLIFRFVSFDDYLGPAESSVALRIILIAALAVTSIPVITRIFIDLGLMETRLARIVLSVAVLEDVLLYVGISLAVGIANGTAKADVSIPSYLHMNPSGTLYISWRGQPPTYCRRVALLRGLAVPLVPQLQHRYTSEPARLDGGVYLHSDLVRDGLGTSADLRCTDRWYRRRQ